MDRRLRPRPAYRAIFLSPHLTASRRSLQSLAMAAAVMTAAMMTTTVMNLSARPVIVMSSAKVVARVARVSAVRVMIHLWRGVIHRRGRVHHRGRRWRVYHRGRRRIRGDVMRIACPKSQRQFDPRPVPAIVPAIVPAAMMRLTRPRHARQTRQRRDRNQCEQLFHRDSFAYTKAANDCAADMRSDRRGAGKLVTVYAFVSNGATMLRRPATRAPLMMPTP